MAFHGLGCILASSGVGVKPCLLDAFSGAGGCTKGYQRAGFYVVGVDNRPQPNYCGDEFIQGDALETLADSAFVASFAAIHASPPCQGRSNLKAVNRHIDHPDHVAAVRELLIDAGLPYVIENVEGDLSDSPLRDPITLCGSSFGLNVRRHRLFECSFSVMGPPCAHGQQAPRFDVYEHGKWRLSPTVPVYGAGGRKAVEHWATAMDIDWMERAELAQAIPPAYTEHIGHYLMAEINARQAA